METLVDHHPDEAWRITCLLVDKTTSDEALAYVAAGPLEDLLKKHGPIIIDRVEDECRRNSRLQLLSELGGMRLRSHGGLADRNVYLMFSRPLNDKYTNIPLTRPLRNFDVFDFVLNGLR